MKRHFQRGTETILVPTLSVEEQAILADENSEAELALDSQVGEVERVNEISEIVGEVDLIVSDVPEVGQVEQELISAVADMAVAGTDADPSDVLPSAIGENPISAEGIVDALKKIWNAIVTAIKNMWVGLRHWLTTYFSTLEQNKRHAEELIKKLDGMKGYVPNVETKNIKISDIFNYGGSHSLSNLSEMFSIGGKDIQLRTFMVNAIGMQTAVMAPMGDALVHAYDAYDGLDGSKLANFIDNLVKGMDGYCTKLGLAENPADGKFKTHIAFMEVVAKNYSKKLADSANSVETKVAFLSKVRFEASQSTDFSGSATLTLKNDTTPDNIKQDVTLRLQLIDALLHMKGNDFKALEAKVEAVQKACEKMLSRIKEENKDGTAQAKRLMQLSSAYASWATQPAAKLLQLSARHIKFWLTFDEMVSNNFVAP